MLHPRGFEVRVAIDEGDLEEYGTKVRDEASMSCYIASQVNKVRSSFTSHAVPR